MWKHDWNSKPSVSCSPVARGREKVKQLEPTARRTHTRTGTQCKKENVDPQETRILIFSVQNEGRKVYCLVNVSSTTMLLLQPPSETCLFWLFCEFGFCTEGKNPSGCIVYTTKKKGILYKKYTNISQCLAALYKEWRVVFFLCDVSYGVHLAAVSP